MQEKLDDPGSIMVQMPFQIGNRPVALLPEVLCLQRLARQPFAAKNLRLYTHDQHLFVVGAVEDADLSPFGQAAGGPPEEIMLQFLGTWMLEAEHLTALRIYAGHHVLDGAVLARRVHGLENQQQGMA